MFDFFLFQELLEYPELPTREEVDKIHSLSEVVEDYMTSGTYNLALIFLSHHNCTYFIFFLS